MKALQSLILAACWAVAAHGQSSDQTINDSKNDYDDLRIIQVKVKTFDPVTKRMQSIFSGRYEQHIRGTFDLLDTAYVSMVQDKVQVRRDMDYFVGHFAEKEWIIIYTAAGKVVIAAQQTSEENQHNFFWWQSLRIRPVTVTSVEGSTINCGNGAGSFALRKNWTSFTANPEPGYARRVKQEDLKSQLTGEWVLTYEQRTRVVVSAHKISALTGRLVIPIR